MKAKFEELHPESLIWIYQSDRQLTQEEQTLIKERFNNFSNSWQSHGSDIKAAGKVFYDRFIVISADSTTNVSGCGIDKSVSFIRNIENELKIKLLDRSFVIYKTESGLSQASLPEIKDLISKEEIKDDTIIFNNTITRKQELENKWQLPLKDSWLSKYIPIKNNNSHK